MTNMNNSCITRLTYCCRIVGERRDFAARAAQGESPCTVTRETPWRGCVSVSLEPAVGAGEEGDGRCECRDPGENQNPESHRAAHTLL